MKRYFSLFFRLSLLSIILLSCNKIKEVAPTNVKKVIDNNLHKVTFESKNDSVYFVMERISKSDYYGIQIDKNANKVVDGGIDVAFGASGSFTAGFKFCSQKLLSTTSSTGCGALASGGKFILTNETFTYIIPRSEISTDDKATKINFTVRFYNFDTKTKTNYPIDKNEFDFTQAYIQNL
jgi:hypothetical protein